MRQMFSVQILEKTIEGIKIKHIDCWMDGSPSVNTLICQIDFTSQSTVRFQTAGVSHRKP